MLAMFVRRSSNPKLGDSVAVTYASIDATCPKDCALRDDGCYAQLGRVGIHEARLDDDGGTERAAREEYHAVTGQVLAGKVRDKTDMRLHVSGDARTGAAARYMYRIAKVWHSVVGGAVWTYTHAWRKVARRNWGTVSVLASCENHSHVVEATARGYAAAIVTGPHKDAKAYKVGDHTYIPCPSQTRGVKCADCRLCFDDKKLASRNAVIAFEAHGARRNNVVRRLEVLR